MPVPRGTPHPLAVAVAFVLAASGVAPAQGRGQADVRIDAVAHVASAPAGAVGNAGGGGARIGYETPLGANHPWGAFELQSLAVSVHLPAPNRPSGILHEYATRLSARGLLMQPQEAVGLRRHFQLYAGLEWANIDYVAITPDLKYGSFGAMPVGVNLYWADPSVLRGFVEFVVPFEASKEHNSLQFGLSLSARWLTAAPPCVCSTALRSK